MTNTVSDVLQRVASYEAELKDLTLRLANTFGPFGREAATAEQAHEWFQKNQVPSRLVRLTEDRSSCVATLAGDGTGKSLVFNAHLDTEASGPDFDNLMGVADPNKVGARIVDDTVYGHVAQNDRACMAAQMIAVAAIKDVGVPLRGDVIVKAVLGETGAAPVDEYEGIGYVGKGLGTEHLVQHGFRSDFAVVAETTDFAPCWVQTGALYVKVTTRGRNMYTPRLVRGGSLREHPNAIVQMAPVIQAIEDWAIRVQRDRTHETPCGTMEPKAQIGAVRGGMPWRPNRSAPFAAVYVDIRTVPGEDTGALLTSLREALIETGVDTDVEIIMEKPGVEGNATALDPLVNALGSAHRLVRGESMPTRAETAVVSMWRDTNIYNRFGVPALTFGPGRGKAAVQGTGGIAMSDLLDAAKIYALAILQVCAEVAIDEDVTARP
jgi:acetylornithine deacetylase/succinyl-diaminopimelate desuccinylase-like protein